MVSPELAVTRVSRSRLLRCHALVVLCLVALQPAQAVEVEIRLVVHDEPQTTIDKRDYLRFIHESVATSVGTNVTIVGMAQTTWVRNALLDGKVVFERFYQGRYVNRLPFAKVDLAPGDHTIWPGNHTFTVAEDGTITSDDPEFIIDGQLVRLKTYEVTLRAYYVSDDGRGVERLAGLPNLTVREATHAAEAQQKAGPDGKAEHLELIVPKRPGDHGTVAYPFAPLKLWLPAHTDGPGYLVHPIGVTFHVTSEGVQAGAGGGKSIDAMQIRGHQIGIPLYRFIATGAAETQVMVGKSLLSWNKVSAGSVQGMALYPQQDPYFFRIADVGPVLPIDGRLNDRPAKSMAVDFSDEKLGTQRGILAEMLDRHLTSGKTRNVRIRGVDGGPTRIAEQQLAAIEGELKVAASQLAGAKQRLSVVDADYRKAVAAFNTVFNPKKLADDAVTRTQTIYDAAVTKQKTAEAALKTATETFTKAEATRVADEQALKAAEVAAKKAADASKAKPDDAALKKAAADAAQAVTTARTKLAAFTKAATTAKTQQTTAMRNVTTATTAVQTAAGPLKTAKDKAAAIDLVPINAAREVMDVERKKIEPQLLDVDKGQAVVAEVQGRIDTMMARIESSSDLNPIVDSPRFARIQALGSRTWHDLKLQLVESDTPAAGASADGNADAPAETKQTPEDHQYTFVVPDLSPGVYKLRLGIRPEGSEVRPLSCDQWVTVTGRESIGLGMFTQRGRDAFYRGEEFWIAVAAGARGETVPVGTELIVTIRPVDGGTKTVMLRQKIDRPIEKGHTFVVQVGADTSLAIGPGRYLVEAKFGDSNAHPLQIDLVDYEPKTHFANVLIGKYNELGAFYMKMLSSGEGAVTLAKALKDAGFNSFKGMSYGMNRVKRSASQLEGLVRQRPDLGPWESYYQPSNRDRFLNEAVRNNIRFWENLFTHHDQMLPRGEKFIQLAQRYTGLEVASMRHSPAFQGVCLYDEFSAALDHDTLQQIMEYFRQHEEINYRRRYPGLTTERAMRGIDRFLARPPGARDPKDIALYRTRREHEDWEWQNFSDSMAEAAKAVLPRSRNFTLQRWGGNNGDNIGNAHDISRVFKNLDIAAVVMYKDGGLGDFPTFAPMCADVMRVRDDIDVWTQLHSHSYTGLYGPHVFRQAFFALSQQVEGLSFFEVHTKPHEPLYIDNADTIRNIATKLTTPYGDLLLACQRGYKRVAIHYSRVAEHVGAPKPHKAPYQVEGLWVACMRAGFPADILHDEQILAGKGLEYDVIFTPNVFIDDEVPPNILKALQRLADAGKVIAVERSSKLPIEGIHRLNDDFGDYDDRQGSYWPKYVDFLFDNTFKLTDDLTPIVHDFLQQHIPPAAEHDLLVGPDWLKCRNGRYLIVSNFAHPGFEGIHKTLYQAPDIAPLRFPKAGEACYDMLEMQRVDVSQAPRSETDDAAWQSIDADMRSYPGKIFAFLPAAIEGVQLEVPAELKGGTILSYLATVRDAAGEMIDAGFPLQLTLTAPDGSVVSEVFRAADPQFRGAYPMPANAAPGDWTLRVRELISGTWTEASVRVSAGTLPQATLVDRSVWMRDGDQIAAFFSNRDTGEDAKPIVIVLDDRQPWVKPHAERLRGELTKRGIKVEVHPYDFVFRLPAELMLGDTPNVDGRRDWRGGVVQPGVFVESPVIVLGRRGENSLTEAIIARGAMAESFTENFPGSGRAMLTWTRRAFSNHFDTVGVLSVDDDGLTAGIDRLLELSGDRSNPGRSGYEVPRVAEFDESASLTRVTKDSGQSRTVFRDIISNEDLVMSLEVDPATGRVLVGTTGYGHNLFCFDADGKLLWKKFLPEHNVYLAQWYDEGRRIVALTARGFDAFLIDPSDGSVRRRFAATEWPRFHGTEGALTTYLNIDFNTKLRQLLIFGYTGVLAVDYEGNPQWFHDRLSVIAEYNQEAEQTAAARFVYNARIGNIAVSPDGNQMAYSESRVIGSAKGFGDSYFDVWAHRPQILDARTGKVLTEYTDNRGSGGGGAVEHFAVEWPAESPIASSRIGRFRAPMNADGTIGEFTPIKTLTEPITSYFELEVKKTAPTLTRRLAADGSTVWERFDLTPWIAEHDVTSDDGGRLYRINPFGLIRCTSQADGRTLWESTIGFGAHLRTLDDDLITGANNGLITRFDANGTPKWQVRLRDLHELPDGNYRQYIAEADAAIPDSSREHYTVLEDGPDDFNDILRMGIEQLVDGGFEQSRIPPVAPQVSVWELHQTARIVQQGRSSQTAVELPADGWVSQKVQRKVVPSATYLLEFWFRSEGPDAQLAAGCELDGGETPTTTASLFRSSSGEWTFGRLAVKSMADTESIEVLFESSGGMVSVDDVTLRPVRFPSANLVANPELHAVEPTYVADFRVEYNRLPTGLREKLMQMNHVAGYRQGGTSQASMYLQEQAFLHNGRLDDVDKRWTGGADAIGFSAVMPQPAWISHIVLYFNNSTPENTYRFVQIQANDFALNPPVPRTVTVLRGNRRRFVVLKLDEPVHSDSIKILPGKHPAHHDCLTEVELYGPLGGPGVHVRAFPDDPDGRPMFMGHPSHVLPTLQPDLTGKYKQLYRGGINATFHTNGTVYLDQYNFGDASGMVRSGEGQLSNQGGLRSLRVDAQSRVQRGPIWPLQTVTMTTTPAHFSGRMFVGAADHKMHAVADNGTWLWGFKTGGRIYSSPVPHGDDVYFGSDDGSLYKVDVDSGILIWEFESGDRIRSAPALWTQGNQIRIAFASYDGYLYCVDGVTGQAIWKSPIAKYTRSSPAIASAGNRIYMADESGKALCFDTVTGKELWNVALDGYLSRCPLVTPDGVAFVTDQGHAALINVSGGVVWQRKLGSRLTAQPAATATQLLIPTEEKLVVLIRKTGQPDARFVTTDLLPNLVDVTPYKDRLYFTQRNVLLVEFGNRSFTEFRSQAGIWQKEATE